MAARSGLPSRASRKVEYDFRVQPVAALLSQRGLKKPIRTLLSLNLWFEVRTKGRISSSKYLAATNKPL